MPELECVHPRIRPVTERRISLGMTRDALAQRSGISKVTIYNLESGRAKRPRFETIRALREAVGLPLEKSISMNERNRIFAEIASAIPAILRKNWIALRAVHADFEDAAQDLALCALRALERYRPDASEASPQAFAVTTMKLGVQNILTRARKRGFTGDDAGHLPIDAIVSFDAMSDAGFQFPESDFGIF